MTSNRNFPLLHHKEFQMLCALPTSTGAATFFVMPDSGNFNVGMYIVSNTQQYLYHHDEDAFAQIPSAALAGTFGAGACGVYHPWSINYTANGGTTSTVTVAAGTHNLTGFCKGATIEFISAGSSSGLRRRVIDMDTGGAGSGTITLTLDSALPAAIQSAHTFRLTTGRFYVLSAGTVAAGIFKVFDVATLTWQASLATTNLPATWGTDGRMVVAYNFGEVQAVGKSTGSNTSTTLANTGKSWTVNQWTNFQVRITSGVGIGQVRTIASNTATALTVSAAWTTTPDATSTYELTANEDYLYLLGNNAVTMYRYSIANNTWTVMAPTTARAGAPNVGCTATCIGNTGLASWTVENAILDGRYIYSFRGNGVATLDRFDIAGGTAGAGAWQQVTYVGTETFTTGSSAFVMGRLIYLRKDATNRFFKFNLLGNYLEPLTTNAYTDGTAALGQKIWVKNFPEIVESPLTFKGWWDVTPTYAVNDVVLWNGIYYKCTATDTGNVPTAGGNWTVVQANPIRWLYAAMNGGVALHRIMLF